MSKDEEREYLIAIEKVELHATGDYPISGDACDLILNTLRKQIPVQPEGCRRAGDDRAYGKCPSCGHMVTSALDHCAWDPCLQRLSWKRRS